MASAVPSISGVFSDTGVPDLKLPACIYLSGEDPRFYKRGIDQYPARLSGGLQSPTEINASGGSQPRKEEGASHHARRGKNAEAFLKERRPGFRNAGSFLMIGNAG